MVDTRDLKSLGLTAVPVQVRPRAPRIATKRWRHWIFPVTPFLFLGHFVQPVCNLSPYLFDQHVTITTAFVNQHSTPRCLEANAFIQSLLPKGLNTKNGRKNIDYCPNLMNSRANHRKRLFIRPPVFRQRANMRSNAAPSSIFRVQAFAPPRFSW